MTESTLVLAKEIANLTLLVVASSLLLVISIVLLILFVYQVRSQNRVVMRFFEDQGYRNVNLDQARSLMESEFEKTRLQLIVHVVKIRCLLCRRAGCEYEAEGYADGGSKGESEEACRRVAGEVSRRYGSRSQGVCKQGVSVF